MEKKSRFLPYPRNLRIFRSRSLNTILEDQDQVNFNMSVNHENNGLPTGSVQQTQQTMNTLDIFNSLRIPDAIKDLPKYDGNPRLLHEFITNVEEILFHIRGADSTPQGLILLRAIRNKIDGQANEVLNTYGTPLNWDDIKTNLISHYSDKRTETSLIRDLHNLRQYDKPVEKFYSQVIEIQSTLTNNVSINESDSNVIKAKRDLFTEMCLNSFLSGLREPMGSTVRAMRPESLAIALDYCIREQNINYLQTDANKYGYSRNRTYPKNGPYNKRNYHNSRHNDNNRTYGQFENTQGGKFQRTNNYNNQPNWRQRQPSREEHGNGDTTQRPNNPHTQNNWARSQPPPEPMDTSSGFSNFNKDSGRFRSSTSTRYSKVSNRNEVNNINEFRSQNCTCQLHDDKNYREDYINLDQYDSHNFEEAQDFHKSASNDKRDT